jgi:hypothetical protein
MSDKKNSDRDVQQLLDEQNEKEEALKKETNRGGEEWLEGFDANRGEITYTGKRSGVVVYTRPANHITKVQSTVLTAIINTQRQFRKRQTALKAKRMAWLKIDIPHDMKAACAKLFMHSYFYYGVHEKELSWEKPCTFCSGGAPTSDMLEHARALLRFELLKVPSNKKDPSKKAENDALWARVQKAKENRAIEAAQVQLREAVVEEHWVCTHAHT